MNSKMALVALALGSNMNDRLSAMRAAIEGMAPYVTVMAKSNVYETPAAYVTNQPAFLNAVFLGETKLSPEGLLHTVKNLERELGRQPSFRYGPRLLDIDILFYGKQIVDTADLHIPHARMAERDFVLYPLNDVAPDWKHPQTGLSVHDMLGMLPKSDPKNLGPIL